MFRHWKVTLLLSLFYGLVGNDRKVRGLYVSVKTSHNIYHQSIVSISLFTKPTYSCHSVVRKIDRQKSRNRAVRNLSVDFQEDYSNNSERNKIRSDPVREATGIRPSLHPVTINAISEALQIRSDQLKWKDMPLRIVDGTSSALDVFVSASKIASNAIEKRQRSSSVDGMTFSLVEQQTIAGRVVGVVLRFSELEQLLFEKCCQVQWIRKYNEWDSVGIIPPNDTTSSTTTTTTTFNSNTKEMTQLVDERIRRDSLFRMNRAECILALYLNTIEKPQLLQKNGTVPDGSRIDFLDADRYKVLIG